MNINKQKISKAYFNRQEITSAFVNREQQLQSFEPLPSDFLLEVDATDGEFLIRASGLTYNYDVETSDGQSFENLTSELNLIFPEPGIYQIAIRGQFPAIAGYQSDTVNRGKIKKVLSWGDGVWEVINFSLCNNLQTIPLEAPNLSPTMTNLGNAFGTTGLISADLRNWDLSNIENMSYMFYACTELTYLDFSTCDISKVTTMFTMCRENLKLKQINLPPIPPSMINMKQMFVFSGLESFTFPQGSDSSGLEDISEMLRSCNDLVSVDLTNMKTDSLETMYALVTDSSLLTSFTFGPCNLPFVIDMSSMFSGCNLLANLDFQNLDFSTGTSSINGTSMFRYASSVNSLVNIGMDTFDASRFNSLRLAFSDTSIIVADLTNWTTSTLMTSIDNIFGSITTLQQVIGFENLELSKNRNWRGIIMNTPLLDDNDFPYELLDVTGVRDNGFLQIIDDDLNSDKYDALLKNWYLKFSQKYPNGGNADGNNNSADKILPMLTSKYSGDNLSDFYRKKLIEDHRILIQDGGEVTGSSSNDFFLIIKSDNLGISNDNQMTISTNPLFTYDYNVETLDGQAFNNVTGDLTITFNEIGYNGIKISGTFPTIFFNNSGDKEKAIAIKSWGNLNWQSFNHSFHGCVNLENLSNQPPILSNVNDISFIFAGLPSNKVESFRLQEWDISEVANFDSFIDSGNTYSDNFISDIYEQWEIFLQTSYPNGTGYVNTPTLNFGSNGYLTTVTPSRTSLINNYNFTITDGGEIASFPTINNFSTYNGESFYQGFDIVAGSGVNELLLQQKTTPLSEFTYSGLADLGVPYSSPSSTLFVAIQRISTFSNHGVYRIQLDRNDGGGFVNIGIVRTDQNNGESTLTLAEDIFGYKIRITPVFSFYAGNTRVLQFSLTSN